MYAFFCFFWRISLILCIEFILTVITKLIELEVQSNAFIIVCKCMTCKVVLNCWAFVYRYLRCAPMIIIFVNLCRICFVTSLPVICELFVMKYFSYFLCNVKSLFLPFRKGVVPAVLFLEWIVFNKHDLFCWTNKENAVTVLCNEFVYLIGLCTSIWRNKSQANCCAIYI